MGTEVIEGNEIILNSIRYPLVGQLRRELTSLFPEKMVTGEYSKLSDINKDAWVISDQRGGVLIEEMDEQKHANRCYWSTCNLGFKGHIFLPKLATSVTIADTTGSPSTVPSITNPSFEDDEANGVAPTGWTNYTNGNGTALTDTTHPHSGTYSLKAIRGSTGDYAGRTQALPWDNAFRSAAVTVSCWIWQDTTGDPRGYLDIYDGQGTTTSTVTTTEGSFVKITATRTLHVSADQLLIRLYVTGASGEICWFDNVMTTIALTGNVKCFATFNGVHYMGKGSYLQKRTATNFTTVTSGSTLGGIITALVPTDDYLFIFCGDGCAGWAMDTNETLTQVPFYGDFGIWWDDKLFGADSKGQLFYVTKPEDPTNASFDVTKNGKLPIDDNDLQALETYYNIDGDDVIYAREKSGVWVHDYANAKWVKSQLQIPEHTNGAKGGCVWRDGLFVSSGLDVIKYTPDVPAQIVSMGLDRDDGMPVEYAGEIVYMTPGYNEFYAAVDASQVAGTGYSTIMAWDGTGWQCTWADASADSAIHAMDVSSVSTYSLWFDDANVVYYIPLHRNLRNPLKISTDTHATGAMHITPWFDADWQVGNKLALTHELYAGADVSSDESIIMKYRTNHTNTDRDTGWTTMDTVVAAGLDTYTFGSSLGTAFKAIQFRYDLARKAADTDETPDILYAVLYYKKVLPKKWGWRFTVDCSHPYHGYSGKQLLDAMVTAAELGTLMTFYYDTTCKYVEVRSVTAVQDTGRIRKGMYDIFVTEL